MKKGSLPVINEYHPLTGLYNFDAFFKKAAEIIEENDKYPMCIISLDIEHFKIYNDWYGRKAGDRLLNLLAGDIKKAAESAGTIAGHFGNDDFALLYPVTDDLEKWLAKQIEEFAKYTDAIREFLLKVGICEINHSMSPAEAYDCAQLALKSIEGIHDQRVIKYDCDMKRKLMSEQFLTQEIRQALKKKEFTCYMQPKCQIDTGEVIGLEALVRWRHPNDGIVGPDVFIPILERNRTVHQLDLFVWDLVCSQLHEWIKEGLHVVPVSVNVSRIDFYSLDLLSIFKGLLTKYDLSADLIELEVTESAYIEDYKIVTDTIDQLSKAGFRISIDDFGSAYSSLNMLKDIEVSVLKLDIKFIQFNRKNLLRTMAILKAIKQMARDLGQTIIVEGVETQEQVNLLKQLDYHYAQGYYFYHPLTIDQAASLLKPAKVMN